MSTPNMSLVLPVDHNSAEIWDTILDTAFGLIDSHDHSTGKGVKVPSAGLKINADVSWSFGGTSYAITELKAIDFAAVAAASVSGLAGALFLSDGTGGLAVNELYYRTTGGTNVKVTSGAALNVAAFTGGIGGDYSSAAALVVFDDATDAYWFQQQIGASVRQYARMRSADVDLYEYKANPAAGVPTNRVRLASPAALAASYALTLPGALPAADAPLGVSSSGQLAFGHGDRTDAVLGTDFIPATPANVTYDQNGRVLTGAAVTLFCRLPLHTGDRIKSVTALFTGDGAVDITSFDVRKTVAAGTSSSIGSTTVNNITSADTTIDVTDTTLAVGESIIVVVAANATALGVNNCRYTFDHP